MAEKPRITVLNKIDALDYEERVFLKEEVESATNAKVMLMSGVSGEGIPNILRALRTQIDDNRLRLQNKDVEEQPWQP